MSPISLTYTFPQRKSLIQQIQNTCMCTPWNKRKQGFLAYRRIKWLNRQQKGGAWALPPHPPFWQMKVRMLNNCYARANKEGAKDHKTKVKWSGNQWFTRSAWWKKTISRENVAPEKLSPADIFQKSVCHFSCVCVATCIRFWIMEYTVYFTMQNIFRSFTSRCTQKRNINIGQKQKNIFNSQRCFEITLF